MNEEYTNTKSLKRAALALSAVFFSLGAFSALAEPAVVINTADLELGTFTGDGDLIFVKAEAVQVITNSATGVVRHTVRVHDMPNSTGRAVKFDPENHPFYDDYGPIQCGILTPQGLFLTYDWKAHVSASGVAVATCLYKD